MSFLRKRDPREVARLVGRVREKVGRWERERARERAAEPAARQARDRTDEPGFPASLDDLADLAKASDRIAEGEQAVQPTDSLTGFRLCGWDREWLREMKVEW